MNMVYVWLFFSLSHPRFPFFLIFAGFTKYLLKYFRPYGSPSGEQMLVDVKHRLDQYNSEQEDTVAKIERTDDGQVVIAICSPVMKRLHTRLKKSGEMIFVDSSGNCDRQYQWIFLLLTHSTAGGLPLGVFITTPESQSTITSGLKLLQSLLPTGSFFGREQPQVIMTDYCRALRQSLQTVFPRARLLLYIFHLLKVWT